MASGVRGVNETIRKIKTFGADAIRQINAETEASAMQIEGDAKKRAPANFGKLRQSISRRKIKPSKWAVTVNEHYGAYMEFGTGTKVNVPNEFKDMANSFRGQRHGNFRQGLDSIKVWCRSRGIDVKYAYVIFAKILGAGINPKPFLYPAWVKGKRDYEKNLKALLRRLNARV